MKSPLRRPRPSLTLELFGVMTIVLVISLVLVVASSDRFLRAIGRELIADQERAATEIVEQSVEALEKQGEAHLEVVLKDRAEQLDKVFSEIASEVNLLALSAERLEQAPEDARDVALVSSAEFRDKARRPADFGPEKGKNRKVSLGSVLWHGAPGAGVDDDVARLRGVGATMRALYSENPLSAWIYLGTTDGLFLGYPSDDSLEASYDPRTREWYRDTKKSGTLTWSLPYLDPSGALLITCSRPFAKPDKKDMAGIAAVDVTIDQLADLMTELERGLSGHAFLLDGSGKLITRGPKTVESEPHGEPFGSENLLDDKEPQLAAVAARMVAGESGLSRVMRADGEQYLAYAHVPSTGWSLGLLVPVDTLVAPARNHEKALEELFVAGGARIGGRVDEARHEFAVWGVIGVSILLGLTTSFVFVRFTIPIKGFIRDIEVITKGNLDHRLVSGAENELGDLAQAFNDMTAEVKRAKDQIEEYSRNLERKVDERTAELAASNAELAEAIRKLQDAQTRLVHSEKMASLGQLVAGIAHEINNPVNFIANSVSPLANAVDDFARLADLYQKNATREEIAAATEEIGGLQETVDQMRRALELIKTGASRTKTIVLQLRNFSRLDEADMKDADIHEGIDGSLALLNYKIKDRINVVKDYGKVGRLVCYPGALNQVFMNVLANGVQAIESAKKTDGTLTITTRREGDNIVVRMRDNGTGIPAHVLPKIFDPFFTTKDKERGTGLGLSITHGIVEKHGGRIDVNTEMGSGTEFVITLPTTGAHVAAHQRS
ncbi:MAG TPA: ATP-binding protein [Planctomycetota bacterium]|nr:ATP-binding protein [Planctomycetota bacterium]